MSYKLPIYYASPNCLFPFFFIKEMRVGLRQIDALHSIIPALAHGGEGRLERLCK